MNDTTPPPSRLVDGVDRPYNFFMGGSVKVYPLHQTLPQTDPPAFDSWTPRMSAESRARTEAYTGGAQPARQIYIHVPFCPAFCHFCILYKTMESDQQSLDYREAYVQALLKEIAAYQHLDATQLRPASAIYFGGGTPSMLTTDQVGRILDAVSKHLPLTEKAEVTFEGMPNHMKDPQYLADLKSLGVNRISYGIQTFDRKLRRDLGRVDTVEDIRECAEAVHAAGIDELNVELLFGIPGMTIPKILSDLDDCIALDCNTLDIIYYNATPGTQYYDLIKIGSRPPQVAGDELLEMRLRAQQHLIDRGFVHTSGEVFDRDADRLDRFQETHYGGSYGLDEILALGPSAYGFLDGLVYQNTPSVSRYIELLDEGRFPLRCQAPADPGVLVRRGLLFGLQLFKVRKSLIQSMGHRQLFNKWHKRGLIEDAGDSWRLTESGRTWYNIMQMEIVPPQEGRAAFDLLLDAGEQERLLFKPEEKVGNVDLVRELETFIEGDIPLLKPVRRMFFKQYNRVHRSRGKLGDASDNVQAIERGQNAFTGKSD